jgi:ring-1,2-phenylacetyl-CoA epoxidase subunit PaaC
MIPVHPLSAAVGPADTIDRGAFADWLLRLGDNALILGHRLSEWCGRGPAVEEDIAFANTALDLIGQASYWLGLAGEVEGLGRSADDLAFRRDARQFRNILLVERPNGDIGLSLMRQFLFDAYHLLMLRHLVVSAAPEVSEIAAKALPEVSYHFERSSDLVIRLGSGTVESHHRMQTALEALWPYVGEFFIADETDRVMADADIAPPLSALENDWAALVLDTLEAGRLTAPPVGFRQFLQRAYPDATW